MTSVTPVRTPDNSIFGAVGCVRDNNLAVGVISLITTSSDITNFDFIQNPSPLNIFGERRNYSRFEYYMPTQERYVELFVNTNNYKSYTRGNKRYRIFSPTRNVKNYAQVAFAVIPEVKSARIPGTLHAVSMAVLPEKASQLGTAYIYVRFTNDRGVVETYPVLSFSGQESYQPLVTCVEPAQFNLDLAAAAITSEIVRSNMSKSSRRVQQLQLNRSFEQVVNLAVQILLSTGIGAAAYTGFEITPFLAPFLQNFVEQF